MFAQQPDSVVMAVAVALVLVAVLAVVGSVLGLAQYIRGHLRFVRAHMGGSCRKATFLSQSAREWERVNLHLALERLRAEAGTPLLTFTAMPGLSLSNLVHANYPRQGAKLKRVASGVGQTIEVPQNAIYLLRQNGEPCCAHLASRSQDDPDTPAMLNTLSVEVVSHKPETARALLDRIVAMAQEMNVYRGKAVALVDSPMGGDYFKLAFHDVPSVRRDEIVLPEEVMQVIERNVLTFLAHTDTLRKAGRNTRHGVLLHGPPGVGKTLVSRYLINSGHKHTAILLTGQNLRFIRESMMLARLLAPSLVLFEDVDLIAEARTTNRFGAVLHELLDELDGLGRQTDCIVLLTTNRADLLEPALANRPGRVDQAIYFGLPDAECRRRLLELYGRGLDLSAIELAEWVTRTEGVSPAFLAEWLRKAALMAAERGEQSEPLKLTETDLERAFRELVLFGGKLTQNILGFRGREATGIAQTS